MFQTLPEYQLAEIRERHTRLRREAEHSRLRRESKHSIASAHDNEGPSSGTGYVGTS